MRKSRILIVEDELIVAEDLTGLLERAGYEVAGACDTGEEAVKLALFSAPDLVLVDIQLRGAMDGINAAQEIRRSLDPAIVYLTAHSEKRLFERARETAPDAYLHKPVSPTDLHRTIEIVLAKHALEKKLRESEQRYRTLVEDCFDGIFVRKGSEIVFANSRLHLMLGYEPGELIGKDHRIIHHAECRDTIRERAESGSRGESATDHFEAKLQSKDGAGLEGEFREKDVVFGGNTCVQVWVRDVTEQRRAEDEIRILGEAVQQSHEGIALVDIAGNIILVNHAFANMHGYGPDELRGTHLSVFHTKDQMPQVDAANRLIRETGEFKGEIQHVRRDGTTFPALMHNTLVLDRHGVPMGMIGTMRDITDLKMVEALLRVEKEQFEALVDHAPFGLVIIDEDYSFRYANPLFHTTFGYSPDIIPNGREWLRNIFPDPQVRKAVVSAWFEDTRSAQPGKQRSRIFSVKCGDGSDKEIHFRPVKLPGSGFLVSCEDITERRHAEDNLRESEEQFRRIIENLQDAFYRADMNGVFTFLSPASVRVAGYTPEEGVGNPITLFYANPAERREFMTLMLQNGFVNDFQARLVHKDGHLVWVSTSARFFKDKHGNIVGIEGIARDISDRKTAEEALSERETLIRSISDNLPSGMIYQVERCADGSRKFTYLSEAVRDFYGCSPDQAMNDAQLIYGRIFPEDRDRVLVQEERAHETFSDFRAEVRMVNPSGDIRWSFFASSPRRLEDGSTCWSGLEIDITDRKMAEEALRKSERLYRSVLENIQDVYYRSDNQGKLVMASPSGAEVFGYDHIDEMIGLSLETLWVNPDGRRQFIETVKTQGKVTDFEGLLRRKDGSIFTASFSTHFYRSEDGQVLGTEGIIRDISERKRVEAQLLQSRKMEAIGSLAGGLAHEVNNLLQVVLGHADMLRLREALDVRWGSSVDAIRRAARSGALLVSRILTFSRWTEPVKRPVNLNDEIRRVEDLLRHAILPVISIKMSLENDLRMIAADPSQIELILLNLAANAGDAMPDGGRLVIETGNAVIRKECCGAHTEVTPGKYVLLAVSDTGHGMEKRTLDRIFEPFFTTKAPGNSAGLGLSTVFGVVKAHGGHITCYSEPGLGTTLKIFFPVLAETPQFDPATTLEMPAGGTDTLLLVDDDDAVRTLAAEMLELVGYTTLTAANGKEALRVYRDYRDAIALVILDLVMPEKSGRECLAELLAINPHVKVLIASGYAAEGPVKEVRERGAAGFLSKPFDVKEVLSEIRTILDRGAKAH